MASVSTSTVPSQDEVSEQISLLDSNTPSEMDTVLEFVLTGFRINDSMVCTRQFRWLLRRSLSSNPTWFDVQNWLLLSKDWNPIRWITVLCFGASTLSLGLQLWKPSLCGKEPQILIAFILFTLILISIPTVFRTTKSCFSKTSF